MKCLLNEKIGDEIKDATTNSCKNKIENPISSKGLCVVNRGFHCDRRTFDHRKAVLDNDSGSKIITKHCTVTILRINKTRYLITASVIADDGNQVNRKLCRRGAF